MIEFVKNHLVNIKSLWHYQKPYLQYHEGSKNLIYLNLIAEVIETKSDYERAYLLQQVTQLLHPLSQYAYNSIKNDY